MPHGHRYYGIIQRVVTERQTVFYGCTTRDSYSRTPFTYHHVNNTHLHLTTPPRLLSPRQHRITTFTDAGRTGKSVYVS